jgi:glycine/D-amino acid oxidase-like deaminating enzyme
MIQGALWDPDAGLVKPRSQMVAGELVDAAVASGKLLSFANTACTGLRIENGRIQGVETTRGLHRRRVCGGVRRIVGPPDRGHGR